MAHDRLERVLALDEGSAAGDWDYYPSTPVREEIVESPRVAGAEALVTRNRSGALVLNTDRVAFVDIDLPANGASLFRSIGSLFRRSAAPRESPETAAIARASEWAERSGARLRVYRTARGLRLLRMDRLIDPGGEECERMFADLGADRQYVRLCRAQRSFRARLTPKPRRVDCEQAPGSHPRVDPELARRFGAWLEAYERASAGRAVCAFAGEHGSSTAVAPALAVSEIHDRRVLAGEPPLV